MSKKFELPIPAEADKEQRLFDATTKSHYNWTKAALLGAPQEIVLAVIIKAAAAGAVSIGFEKKYFLDVISTAFDHFKKEMS